MKMGLRRERLKLSARTHKETQVLSMLAVQPLSFDKDKTTIHLKKNHNYYYQVQGQIAVLNMPWCDFVVWTTQDMHIERIFLMKPFGKLIVILNYIPFIMVLSYLS